MTTPVQNTPVLVLGGTGMTGRRVAHRLASLGVPVRIGSRAGAPPFDWHDRATWAPALAGMRAAYVVHPDGPSAPGAEESIGAFARLAVGCGAERLVFLAGRGEAGALRAEAALVRSSAAWTILRSAFFNQNFDEYFLLDAVRAGEIAFPAGEIGEPFVDADDLADVAVAALTRPGHTNAVYDLTGPRLLTWAAAAAEIATASGREVRYRAVSSAEFAATLTDGGAPPEFATAFTELLAEVCDGRNAHLGDGVARALGRAPRDFTAYARAARGAWAAGPSAAGPAQQLAQGIAQGIAP